MSVKYQVFYPGQYLDWEKSMVEEIMLRVKSPAPPGGGMGGPGRPRGSNIVTENELLNYNHNWDPYNPLFNDKNYARAAGYPDVPAWPMFKQAMGGPPTEIPRDKVDLLYLANDGSDLELFVPVYPGDSFTTKPEKSTFEDVTVPGSDLRTFKTVNRATLYNQRGELAVRSTGTLRNSYRKIIDGSPKPSYMENEMAWVREFPPAHYTTDKEWEYIKELWRKEYIRGKNTLYWEDVKIGDEPAWTCSGTISYNDMVGWYGGSSMPYRDRVMKGAIDLFRDQYGQYLAGGVHFGGRNIPGSRMVFYNDTGCKHIVRMLTNYIGDAGFVTKVSWRFMKLFKEMRTYEPGKEILEKVPYMKGKACNRHGSEGDTVIAKGYVTDKHISEKGEHIIDLSCWGETLDGDIVEVVAASASLPSREG